MIRSALSAKSFAVLTVLLLVASACNRDRDASVQPVAGTNEKTTPEAKLPAKDVGPGDSTDETVPDREREPAGELMVGDMAPTLIIGQWLKGEPIDGFQDGHVYVVEFWATWCGPCRAGMPHISQLQEQFTDRVTFIGVTAEEEQTVRSFLGRVQNPETGETWDQVVKYTIALDSDRATNAAYMEAAKQRGIPAAFVVGKDGYVEWIGHPMTIDEPLESIVGGTWDRAAAQAEFAKKQAKELAFMTVSRALQAAQENGDWTKALEVLDSAVKQFPDDDQFRFTKLNALLKTEQFDSAHTVAEEIANGNWDNARFLNAIAWVMATESAKSDQCLESALRIATRASFLENDEDAMILDTVARVCYEQGNLKEAVAWQGKAVEHDSSGGGSIKEMLQKYEAELAGGDEQISADDASKPDGDASDTEAEADAVGGEDKASELPAKE